MNIVKIYVLNSLKDVFQESKQTEKQTKALVIKNFSRELK